MVFRLHSLDFSVVGIWRFVFAYTVEQRTGEIGVAWRGRQTNDGCIDIW